MASSDDKARDLDPRAYLEEIEGKRALEWVENQKGIVLERIERDPRFKENESEILKGLQNPQRIIFPTFSNRGKVDDFWQDDVHVRGIWRRTDEKLYTEGKPQWDIILDIDELAKKEKRNWVFNGGDCLPPESTRCLIMLSDGGKDAVTVREFDVQTKSFVAGGFVLPEGKQEVAWIDRDTLYVAREWTSGEITTSGYAYITKRLKRGQSLSEGTEIFRGEKTDISAGQSVLRDINGRYVIDLSTRILSVLASETKFITPEGAVSFPLPLSSDWMDYHKGQIVYLLKEDWRSARGTEYAQGSLISFDLFAALKNPANLEPLLLSSASPHQSVEGIIQTENHLIVQILSNVMSEIHSYTFDGGKWSSRQIPFPRNLNLSAYSADHNSDDFFVSADGFLEPTTLYRANADSLKFEIIQSAPKEFDSTDMKVEQKWVTSKDGTRIPYFLVSRKNIPLDGSTPTLLYAYGGFEVAMTPSYMGSTGKLWLEKGGAYVLANIRGGGEFGAAWHQAGLKTRRQNIFNDFQAVAEDLIAGKITSPRRLGIMGGSNGGLLMGVQLIQRPDLWNAVVIQVPLLDMLRYTRLPAGASWIGEYGDPDDPVEGAFLKSISPYHNLKAGTKYPEPLFMTSTKDDRVHPGHARKMAAKMQDMNLPFLYFENMDGGHAAAATPVDSAKIEAIEYTYLMQKLMD